MMKQTGISRRFLAVTAGVLTAVTVVSANAERKGIEKGGVKAEEAARKAGAGVKVELGRHEQTVTEFVKRISVSKMPQATLEKVADALNSGDERAAVVLGILTNANVKAQGVKSELEIQKLEYAATKIKAESKSAEDAGLCDKLFNLDVSNFDENGQRNLVMLRTLVLAKLSEGVAKDVAFAAGLDKAKELGLKDLTREKFKDCQ